MPSSDAILLGNTRWDIVALIEGAITASTILPVGVREHYRKRHPETQDATTELVGFRALVEPDRAMEDLKYPNTVNVFLSLNDTDDVMVSLAIATQSNRSNRVKSIRTHPKARTEELWNDAKRAGKKWPEGGSATPAKADEPKL